METFNEPVSFGGILWLPLAREPGKALLLAGDILTLRPFDTDFTDEIWESCELRRYLNGEFLDRFSKEEKARIFPTVLPNPKNPWFDTPGGEDTTDSVFLLDIEEAAHYFGDSLCDRSEAQDIDGGRFVPPENGPGGFFSGSGDPKRVALYRGVPGYWWLRSPGVHHSSAAVVLDNGGIGVLGFDLPAVLDVGGVGVRPALWLRDG